MWLDLQGLLTWIRSHQVATWSDFYRGESFRLYHTGGLQRACRGFRIPGLIGRCTVIRRVPSTCGTSSSSNSLRSALSFTVDPDRVIATKGT
jgi:hypothetical protein